MMAVFRVNRNKNYTHMANYHFREKKMSLKAKGLLSLMLSLPEEWDYSVRGLAALSKDGKDSVMNTLTELESFGYLKRTKIYDKGRFAGYDYDIFEKPKKPDTENPYPEKPCPGNQDTENPPQLNTNQLNTNQSSNKEINIYPFEAFWEVYPKKRAKEDARKAWAKIKPDEALGKAIIQAVENAKKSTDWQKEKGQYIPYPATYLNGKRWEDERNDTDGKNTDAGKVQYGRTL
jgi:hypothetical protein